MQPTRTYSIRQGVLAVAAEFAPAPFGLDDLEAAPALARYMPLREELLEAWRDLAVYGYIAILPASNGELAKITDPGLAQHNGDAARDARIWGRYAL